MKKKRETELSRNIYNDAIDQAEELAKKGSLSFCSSIYKKTLNYHEAGAHRIRSRFGGYGAHCYKSYDYGEFQFCINHHTDYEAPTIKVSLLLDDSPKASMWISLSEDLWEGTDLFTLLSKAHHTMSLDFKKAVEENNYTDLLNKVDDPNDKEWVISHINNVHAFLFDRTELARANKEQQQKLREQLRQLEDEYKCLKDKQIDESKRLTKELHETHLSHG